MLYRVGGGVLTLWYEAVLIIREAFVMRAVYFLCVLVGVFAGGVFAQDEAKIEKAKQLLAKDEKQVVFLRERVSEAKARVDTDVERLRAKDKQIEKKINDVIKLITSVRDSTDSKTRVILVKKDVIDELNKSVEFYKQRRRARVEKLRQELASPEKFENDKVLDFLDERIDKRIDQIIYITSTMTQAKEWKDSEKYTYTNYGYDGVRRRTSDKYVRHRKGVSQSNMQRKETMQILEQYEASIERENKRLQQKLDATSKPEDRKAVEELIQKNNKRLQEQRSKTRNMVSYSHETGRAISREQAFETDRWVEDMSKGIVRDFHDFVRLVSVARDDNFNLSLWQDRLKKGENFVERRKKAIAEATQKLEKSKAEKSPETDVPQ